MIAVSGYLKFRPEDRADMRVALAEVQERSRTDRGCLEYWWAEDLGEPGVFRFFECWESQEAFEAHRDAPYERDFDTNVLPRIIGARGHRHVVSDRGPAFG